MGFIDSAFKNIKLRQPTFIVWRIENFELKPIPSSRYGSFYEGDSYIIYSAAPHFQRKYKNGGSEKLEYHIHFWLGKLTTTDESITAVVKTVELDEILNGVAIQHREIQGHESNRFKSYFKNNIRILKGGIASGLHHVSDTYEARLFKIKGKRRPVMTQQPSISWEWFNSGDVFILETKNKIFIWVGKESNKMEKFQAGKVGIQMKNEGPGLQRTIIFVEDGKENELKDDDLSEFEQHLNLAERVVAPAETDVETEEMANKKIKLYRCTDEDGTFNVIHVKDGPLKQEDLNSMDTFIIDNNINGLWIWIGKRASAQERAKGMKKAQDFLKTNNYPSTTSITRVVDGAEPIEFQMLFLNWKDSSESVDFNRPTSGKKTANLHFNAARLHDSPNLAADTQLVDNGSGKTQIWRLHNKELELVPEDHFGLFFSGDCYLILYTYEVHGKENYILYFWLGAHSSQDERGTIAWHAVKKDDELHGSAVQVRVVQSKEPPQFLMIFKGKMIIFNGGYASSFDGPNGKNEGIPINFMIQVRGGGDNHTTQSVQVKMSASALNSNDVFVLHTKNKTYVWCGKGSTGDERERAKSIAEEWSRTSEYQVLLEGSETENFWELLGGKQDYASEESLTLADNSFYARLFHCSNASGYFKAEEIFDFSQLDLVPNDIMVLDIENAVFIWVGKGANKVEKTEAPKLVEEYLKTDPRDRDLDTPVITVQQGFEPPNFTGFFGAWDNSLWESSSYKEMESEVPESSKIININSSDEKKADEITKYPIDKLAHKTAKELPDDVDVLHRELHITEEDFEAAFGMSRIQYDTLPAWKQNNLKKVAGLF